jgi:SAM-dependent methyltransferase
VPGVVEKVVKVIVEKNSVNSVLEISSGYGNFISKLPTKYYRAATEYSSHCILYLQKAGIHAVRAKLPSLPFENSSFDVVVSISVFEHLHNVKQVRQSFREVHRVARKLFILSVPFNSMQPWKTLMHNFSFTREQIEKYIKGLFHLRDITIDDDGRNRRAIYVLAKQDK